jgi:hypothetical protein
LEEKIGAVRSSDDTRDWIQREAGSPDGAAAITDFAVNEMGQIKKNTEAGKDLARDEKVKERAVLRACGRNYGWEV